MFILDRKMEFADFFFNWERKTTNKLQTETMSTTAPKLIKLEGRLGRQRKLFKPSKRGGGRLSNLIGKVVGLIPQINSQEQGDRLQVGLHVEQ